MARETDTGESNASGTADASRRIEVVCPHCESRWTCDGRESPTCPDCDAGFSVRVREEFALVERSGWTVAVSRTAGRPGAIDG